ncbi:hypothetical protein A3D62_01825 [Candidatus Kaiserbacteria bacterium RIFCSPHIGHO2_02_FULL_49_11]|uniref:Uncharacterized protein n=2 Tax=Parcubacteria group TaxID=1794811 RepID=A0A1F6D125_9BACT|nr:MAG: hypothetical protein A3D62_01825 [Candidatus Kaiserbacteria bacterium RIFCSPHIGHO2_02_FULL_49_11]
MNVLTIPTTRRIDLQKSFIPAVRPSVDYRKTSLEEKVTLLLTHDLVRLGWRLHSNTEKSFELAAPNAYSKEIIKQAMAYSRNALINRNQEWIQNHIELARANLARGEDVLVSKIKPRIEVCETKEQNNLFRLFRYYWSSPASDYVGRRMRLIIRDDGVEGSPVMGIAAIGSSIIHIPDRDKWIGWDTKTRSENLISMMDAYVIGALPPYNELLGGKLMAYILASNELRTLYKKKYRGKKTIIKGRTASRLVLLATTSLYGTHSAQYARLKYGKTLLYQPIGSTSGYGSLHISSETFEAMRELAEVKGFNTSNRFGMGPNWRMRIIRATCDILKLDSDVILKHSFQRGLYAVSLAVNSKSFLRGESKSLIYRNMPLKKLVKFWKKRWFDMRIQNPDVIQRVRSFSPANFEIKQTLFD